MQEVGQRREQLPRTIDYQKLLFHKKAVGHNRFCATGSQELSEGSQQMYEEHDQILHGETE